MKRCMLVAVLLGFVLAGQAQKKTADTVRSGKDIVAVKPVSPTGIKPYSEVITSKAISHHGLFIVHHIDDKWFFEIADSLLGREMLVVTRYEGTPGGVHYYGGEMTNEQAIYWEKGPDNKLLLRVSIYVVAAKDSSDAIAKAVHTSSVDPIVAAFEIKSINPAGNGIVIDVTDFFKGDNQIVSLSPNVKTMDNLGSLASDKSFVTHIRTFPINTEVHTVKTFMALPSNPASFFSGNRPAPAATETGVVTLEMNNSFILLPKTPMGKRLFDPRVGFFADEFTAYEDASQKADPLQYILRWRMEPKPEDLEKFKRGELVEPAKQIVYYIDPATPKQWRPYLIAGINDWQKAFEQAGFKNAIIGKEWPENDSTMSLEDARYSVLRYFASDVANAYGPNVHDPRSGEILESHIGWYHNVMTLLHDWYMIQAGPIDPGARTMKFDDSLMGQLIRFVSSHEIGHTLGLRHNMGSSSQTPVEKLRDKAWVEANGHTISIMDYARFNYVAQPEDHIGRAGIFPRIGAYDKWAIQWGYRPILGTKDYEEDRKILNKWIVDSLKANPRLWFGGEGVISEPRSQSEDLGDNAMKAGDYGIKNLQRVMKAMPEWTKEEGDLYSNMKRIYGGVVEQYKRYLFHAGKNIAGAYMTIMSVEQKGSAYQPVPKATLKEVVNFWDRQLFQTPLWLVDSNVVNKLMLRPLDEIKQIQSGILRNYMSAGALLQVGEMANISKEPYTIDEYMTDLEKCIWKEVAHKEGINEYRRNLQKIYLQTLADLITPPAPNFMGGGITIIQPESKNSDLQSVVRAHLLLLSREVSTAIPFETDRMTKYHLEDVRIRIGRILDPNK